MVPPRDPAAEPSCTRRRAFVDPKSLALIPAERAHYGRWCDALAMKENIRQARLQNSEYYPQGHGHKDILQLAHSFTKASAELAVATEKAIGTAQQERLRKLFGFLSIIVGTPFQRGAWVRSCCDCCARRVFHFDSHVFLHVACLFPFCRT